MKQEREENERESWIGWVFGVCLLGIEPYIPYSRIMVE